MGKEAIISYFESQLWRRMIISFFLENVILEHKGCVISSKSGSVKREITLRVFRSVLFLSS